MSSRLLELNTGTCQQSKLWRVLCLMIQYLEILGSSWETPVAVGKLDEAIDNALCIDASEAVKELPELIQLHSASETFDGLCRRVIWRRWAFH